VTQGAENKQLIHGKVFWASLMGLATVALAAWDSALDVEGPTEYAVLLISILVVAVPISGFYFLLLKIIEKGRNGAYREGPFEADGVLAGIPYRVREGGIIEAMMHGGLVRFKNLEQFRAASEGRDVPPSEYSDEVDGMYKINADKTVTTRTPIGKRGYYNRLTAIVSLAILAALGFIYLISQFMSQPEMSRSAKINYWCNEKYDATKCVAAISGYTDDNSTDNNSK
jgi:hypothetical protein